MRDWAPYSLILAVTALAPAEAVDPGTEVTVTVETNLARKHERLDRIWSAVVLATNPPAPKESSPELREYASRLRRVFGYNQFEIVGSAVETIDEQKEHWLVPSQSFWLGVKSRRAMSREARGGYLINLQLFQDKRQLVTAEAKLAPGSPLFIRGPACEKGQIIIILQVQR